METTELLALPLFLGMNKSDLEELHDMNAIAERRVRRGTVIAEEGKPCQSIIILTKGTATCCTHSDDHSYTIEERLEGPLAIQPERIFGMYQRYSATYQAATHCEMLVIDKTIVMKLTEKSMAFRINLLNMVATQSQRLRRQNWHQNSERIDKRIIRFVKDRVTHPAGNKRIKIQMTTLARELGCSRLEVSEALHTLEDKSLIRMYRGGLEIPMLELLLMQH